MSDLVFSEVVPYRAPPGALEQLKEFFTNKNVYDLGCGSGDAMTYILFKLKPKSIKGINHNEKRYRAQKERYNLNIIQGDIKEINFKKEDIDTYYIWIEEPSTEIFVINALSKLEKKCNILIGYNIKAFCKANPESTENYNKECRTCKYLECIEGKINEVKTFLQNKNIKFQEKNIEYNEGRNCRQSGTIKFIII